MPRRRDWDITPEQKMDARIALRALEGTGLTLQECVRRALEGAKVARTETTIEAGVDGFLQRLLKMDKRSATFRWYDARLGAYREKFDGQRMDDVSRKDLSAWLTSLPIAPQSQAGYLRAVRALYNWARSKEPPLCMANPTEALSIEVPTTKRTPRTLTAEHAKAALDGVCALNRRDRELGRDASAYRYAVPLMLFAGIRPEEIAGQDKPPLDFAHIDVKAKTIRIPPEIAKTGHPRSMTKLLPVLWEWMKGCPKSGPVCPNGSQAIARNVTRIIQEKFPDFEWEEDILRNTAASTMMALWQDPGRVSTVLGHEGRTQLLHTRYNGVIQATEAKKIAALKPPA